MSDPFIGEVRLFGGNYAPNGWALCDGQLLPIAQNEALFSLLGTTYGGDGQTTFALPDLRGRCAPHPGGGVLQGETGGSEVVTLQAAHTPAHPHAAAVAQRVHLGQLGAQCETCHTDVHKGQFASKACTTVACPAPTAK